MMESSYEIQQRELKEEARRRLQVSHVSDSPFGENLGLLLSYPSLVEAPFIPKAHMIFVKPIGQGSFGEVYKGIMYNQDVAIKQLTVRNFVDQLGESADQIGSSNLDSPSGAPSQVNEKYNNFGTILGSLEKEVRILRKVSHKKIVLFLGVCLDPPCIITEYCHQGSLYDLLARARDRPKLAKKLTWLMRIRLALDAATGMDYLHTSTPAVVHGDLKTPNLLVDEHWNCKVADFNTSRFVDPSCVTSSISANNPRWMAPELLNGGLHTKKSDVYPFGLVLWELMTWKTPWEDETRSIYQISSYVVADMRPTIPEEDKDLPGDPCPFKQDYINLIQICWDTDPDKRPDYSRIVNALSNMRRKIESETKTRPMRPSTPDPPVTPRLPTVSPFQQTPFQSSNISQLSPFAIDTPYHRNNQVKEDDVETVTIAPRELPQGLMPEQKTSEDPSDANRKPARPLSFKPWSEALPVIPTRPPPTNPKDAMKHIRDLFANPVASDNQDDAKEWEVANKVVLDSMIPELNLSPIIPSLHQMHQPKPNPNSKWRFVRDVFGSGAAEKKAEHPGWQLIKRILLTNNEENDQAESPQEGQELSGELSAQLQLKWDLLKHIFFSNDIPRSPGWDFIHQVITTVKSRTNLPDGWEEGVQESSATSAQIEEPAKELTPAQKKWKFLRNVMNIKVQEESPSNERHPGWDLLKELIGDDKLTLEEFSNSSGSRSRPSLKHANHEMKLPSKIHRYWDFLQHIVMKNEGSLLVKHWDFLKGAIGDLRETTDNSEAKLHDSTGRPTLKEKPQAMRSLASKRWKKVRDLLIVDYDPPSEEKWCFLREWLTVDMELGEDWDQLRYFARDCVEVPRGPNWEIFRTLFFEDRGLRNHPHWAFLKDLLVKDALLPSAQQIISGEVSSTKEFHEVSTGIRDFVLNERAQPPSESKWKKIRSLFQVQAPSQVREAILDETAPPDKSSWDKLLNLLIGSTSKDRLRSQD